MNNVATIELTNPVGLREWRANLSAYMVAVKQGHVFTITERGQAVAQMVPMPGASAYERLIRQGVVEPATRRDAPFRPPIQVSSGDDRLL